MSQHYLLPCSCGQKVRVAVAEAGGQATCGCGKTVAVPTLRGLRALEPAAPEIGQRAAAGWSATHGLFFSGGLILTIAGIALLSYHLFYYALITGRIDNAFGRPDADLTVDQTEAYAAAHMAEVDKLSATQLFEEWSEVVAKGLGEKSTPPWVAAKNLVTANQFWMSVGCGAIAVGLLMSVGSLFVARPRRT